MKASLYQIDAFTDTLFGGNPAAVCPLKEWIDTSLLQKIAAENNVTETAFIVPREDSYEIRWFTPTVEVDLCGHATLASAYVIFNKLNEKKNSIRLKSQSGELIVTRDKEFITLDFPSVPISRELSLNFIGKALGISPAEIWRGMDYLAVVENEDLVRRCQPNFEMISKLDARGLIVTARGKRADFVSRFFAPRVGLNEDFVTGSAHCLLAPYWARQLNKNKLYAEQLSPRLGKIYCEVKGDRVLLSGKAVPYLHGEIDIPIP